MTPITRVNTGAEVDNFKLDTRALTELVEDIDGFAEHADIPEDRVTECLVAWHEVARARQELAVAEARLADRLAEAMGTRQIVVDGYGVFERHRKTDRRKWDSEELRRVVLDTKLVDPSTGEVKDETPVEKILHVWNLSAPRLTALRERNIDPDDYCESQRGGWALQVTT